MEKFEKSKDRKESRRDQKAKPWDCGSSLYDSFELNSFKRQLDSAISSRSLSMPHLSDRRVLPVPEIPNPPATAKDNPPAGAKKTSKISRSINKLLRSFFKPKPIFRCHGQQSKDGPIFIVYDKTGALTTIPEAPEFDFGGFSPEIASLVKRTGSERFIASNSIGISCA